MTNPTERPEERGPDCKLCRPYAVWLIWNLDADTPVADVHRSIEEFHNSGHEENR